MSELCFSPDERYVRVTGRTVLRDGVRWLGFSGASVEFRFYGSSVKAELWADYITPEGCGNMFQSMAAVFVDGELYKRVPVENGRKSYELFSSEKAAEVTVRIMRFSDQAFGRLGVGEITADGEPSPTKSDKPVIEFIGDSITCGFGDEGGAYFSTASENPWETFSALTARRLDCEFSFVSRTCIGIYSSSVDEGVNEPNVGLVMPRLYEYASLVDDEALKLPAERWDFNSHKTALIVINLGTNDATFTRGIEQRCTAFGDACRKFVQTVREHNPKTAIVYALGAMGQELCPYAENAVRDIENVYTLRFEEQNPEIDGIGAEKHPSLATHRKMADRLVNYILEKKLL